MSYIGVAVFCFFVVEIVYISTIHNYFKQILILCLKVKKVIFSKKISDYFKQKSLQMYTKLLIKNSFRIFLVVSNIMVLFLLFCYLIEGFFYFD